MTKDEGTAAVTVTANDVTTAPTPRMPYEAGDDGCPDAAWLADFAARDYGPAEAAAFLVGELPRIANQGVACAGAEVTDLPGRAWRLVPTPIEGFEGAMGRAGHLGEVDDGHKRVTLTTGGWSGAEELVAAVLAHPAMRDMHDRWERGGLFSFLVPCALLPPELAAPVEPSHSTHAFDALERRVGEGGLRGEAGSAAVTGAIETAIDLVARRADPVAMARGSQVAKDLLDDLVVAGADEGSDSHLAGRLSALCDLLGLAAARQGV